MPLFDPESYRRIPYEEYKAIGELFRAHLKTHEKQLRAVVAFGPLVTHGDTFDIDLLEVVDGWEKPVSVTFRSTAALPLRGLLRLNILSTQEFKQPSEIGSSQMKSLRNEVFERLQQGYEVIYEDKFGFVRQVLSQENEATVNINPLTFLDSSVTVEEIR